MNEDGDGFKLLAAAMALKMLGELPRCMHWPPGASGYSKCTRLATHEVGPDNVCERHASWPDGSPGHRSYDARVNLLVEKACREVLRSAGIQDPWAGESEC